MQLRLIYYLLIISLVTLFTGEHFAYSQTVNFPFPQHFTYTEGTIFPSNYTQQQLDDSTSVFYTRWKERYLINGCEPNQYYVFWNYEGGGNPPNSISISEGHGYGMIITALFAGFDVNAKNYFDGLYRYFKTHPTESDSFLMAWNQITGCVNAANGGTSATDGDLDIAYALLLADKQWGSNGEIDYLAEAKNILLSLEQNCINPITSTVTLGNWVNSSNQNYYYGTRTSDFMFSHFQSFTLASKNPKWNQVKDKCYELISSIQNNYSASTGLLPDFIYQVNTQPKPAPANYLEGNNDGKYYYNACRVPWRVAMDYLHYGDIRAKNSLEKINTFIKSTTNSSPQNILPGYALNGTPIHTDYVDLPFIAPFAVSAMTDYSHQQWLNSMWNYLLTFSLNDASYYGNTLKLLSMIAVSGNWWNPQILTFGNSLYVSTNGNDNNPGTELLPLKTVQRALNIASAGTTIFVKEGIYNEKITFTHSGNVNDGFITLRNYGGDTAILDGTGKMGEQMILIENKSYLKIIGLEIQNNLNQSFGSGIWIKGNGTHIEIRNNRIHDMKATTNGDAMAISVYGTNATPFSNIIIDSNTIYNCQPGHSEALTLNGNVDTFQITHNIVHDVNNIGIDMIGGEGTCPDANQDAARNGICRNNIVYNAHSNYGGGYAAGIYSDGGINIIIENNLVFSSDAGFEIGCENQGRISSGIILRNNIAYNNDKRGIGIGGYNFPQTGKVINSYIVNNTLFNNDILNTTEGELVVEYTQNCWFENNIFYASSQNRLFVTTVGNNSGNIFNHNTWYSPGGNSSVTIDFNGTIYSSFTAYQNGTGQDGNSVFGNPLFIFPSSSFPDFHLLNNSPAINIGNNSLSTILGNFDYDGNERIQNGIVDCGAFEMNTNAPNPPQNLTVAGNDSLVILRWNKNSENNILRYRIYGSTTFHPISQIDSTTDTSITIVNLQRGVQYYFRITSVNTEILESGFSNEVNFTTLAFQMFRTFKSDTSLSKKANKVKIKKNVITVFPNIATVIENIFITNGKIFRLNLGIPQTSTNTKKYAWLQFKKSSEIGNLYTSSHTDNGIAYPIDSLRSGTKAKKMSKAITPTRKNFDNIAFEQGVVFKMNIVASEDTILPYGFGDLILDTSFVFIGKNLNGMALKNIAIYFDSVMTYWEIFGINNQTQYENLYSFSKHILKRINDGFFALMDTSNYEIDKNVIVKKPYSVKLDGVKLASEIGIIKQFTEKNISNFSEENNFLDKFSLKQNYPNPFNPKTKIKYEIAKSGFVNLKVFDVLGREIKTLVNESQNVGTYEIDFDASHLNSGMYFYKLTTNNFSEMKKMILVK